MKFKQHHSPSLATQRQFSPIFLPPWRAFPQFIFLTSLFLTLSTILTPLQATALTLFPTTYREPKQTTDLTWLEIKNLVQNSPRAKDLEQIFAGAEWVDRISKDDCYLSAASRLQRLCTSRNMDQVGRSGVAISLTLCAMASALQPLPSECLPWSAGTEGRGGRVVTGDAQLASCLSALHRSPQDWTSYNGYLSDATRLCHALVGIVQTDQAREMYANATTEKIALLRFLQQNEASRREHEMQQEFLLDAQLKAMNDLRVAFQAILRKTTGQLDANSIILDDLRAAVVKENEKKIALWDSLEMEGKERLAGMSTELFKEMRAAQESWADLITTELQAILADHWAGMEMKQMQWDKVITGLARKTRSSVEEIGTRIEDVFALANVQSSQLSLQLNSASSDLEGMLQTVAVIDPLLRSSLEVTRHMQTLQMDTSVSLKQAAHQSRILNDEMIRSVHLLNSSMDALTIWKNRLVADEPRWFWSTPSFSLFSAPSLISSSSMTLSPQLQALSIAVQWSTAILAGLGKIALFSIGTLASVVGSFWLLLRLGATVLLRQLGAVIWQDLKTLIEQSTDEEKRVSPEGSSKPPIPSHIKRGPIMSTTGRSCNQSFGPDPEEIHTCTSETRLKKFSEILELGRARRAARVGYDMKSERRRAVSEPP